jgi:hypothetical protein
MLDPSKIDDKNDMKKKKHDALSSRADKYRATYLSFMSPKIGLPAISLQSSLKTSFTSVL